MLAGRELDALIAEKVMGLAVQRDQVTLSYVSSPKADDPWDYFVGDSNDRVSAYSSDIAAAWLIVHELSTRSDQDFRVYRTRGEWRAWFTTGKGKCEGVGQDAAHAICLAALKAVSA